MLLNIHDGPQVLKDRLEQMQTEYALLSIANTRLCQRTEGTLVEWQNTFNAMSVGISLHSPDFRIIRANNFLGSMLSVAPESLVGKYCYEVFHKKDGPVAECPMAGCKAGIRTAETWRKEIYLGNRWLLWRCDPVLNPDGRLTGMVHVIRDITVRKQREEERRVLHERLEKTAENLKYQRELLNIIVESTEARLAYLDPEFNYVWVNSVYAGGSGHPPEDLIGRNHFSLFPDGDTRSVFERVRNTGQAVEYHDKPFLFPDQTSRGITYWDWTLTPVKDNSGRVQGLVLSLIDMTPHKKIEQLKDEFISMLSHEIRTPLTVVIGALDTVLSENKKLSEIETLNLIRDAQWGAQTLSHIQENLLELARSQANKLYLHPSLVSIPDLVEKMVRQVKKTTTTHRFVTELPPEMPLPEVDDVRLERILYNLLENAVKYSPGGGDIRVFAHLHGTELTIGVSDQGIGMSGEQQARIFKPFERLAKSGEGVKGIGLGLVVCQRLVEAHKGKIWVKSSPGRGSTFYFTLPLSRE